MTVDPHASLPLDELLDRVYDPGTLPIEASACVDEIRRRFLLLQQEKAAAERERDEAREKVRLHVECMCGHLVDDHDGECQAFRSGAGGHGGAVEVECDCQNFRPAWAAWWERGESAERDLAAAREAMNEDDPAKWSFDTLLVVADAILARHYPESIFPQVDGDEGEPGPVLIRRLRDALIIARAALGGDTKGGTVSGAVVLDMAKSAQRMLRHGHDFWQKHQHSPDSDEMSAALTDLHMALIRHGLDSKDLSPALGGDQKEGNDE